MRTETGARLEAGTDGRRSSGAGVATAAGQALAPLEAAFFHVESATTPMHMASIGLFEGPPLRHPDGSLRIDDIRRMIASRIALVPRLRQRPGRGLLGQAPPVWIDDADFDVARHVTAVRVAAPGGEAELRALCGELMAAPLSRAHPLWSLIFVEGLADGRVALLEKLHHSMADGLAAADLATVLLDLSPEPPPVPGTAPAWEPADPVPAWRGATRDLLRLGELSWRVGWWGVQSARHPLRRARELAALGQAVGTLATPKVLAPRSSLNRPITGSRAVHLVRLPFDEVHGVAHAWDATVNDVLLSVVAGGLRQLLGGRGELDDRSQLQALVPVGLAHAPDHGLGNSVSALLVRLPVGDADPLRVLRCVRDEVRGEKRRHQELAAGTMLGLLEPLPQGVLAPVAAFVQHQPFFNLIVTNVPGPPVPLYALGARLLEAFPMVPLAANQGLGVAALSYQGALNLGVLSDPVTCPDAQVFCDGVCSTLRELVAWSG